MKKLAKQLLNWIRQNTLAKLSVSTKLVQKLTVPVQVVASVVVATVVAEAVADLAAVETVVETAKAVITQKENPAIVGNI